MHLQCNLSPPEGTYLLSHHSPSHSCLWNTAVHHSRKLIHIEHFAVSSVAVLLSGQQTRQIKSIILSGHLVYIQLKRAICFPSAKSPVTPPLYFFLAAPQGNQNNDNSIMRLFSACIFIGCFFPLSLSTVYTNGFCQIFPPSTLSYDHHHRSDLLCRTT